MKCEIDIIITYEIEADTLEDALEKGIDQFKKEGIEAKYFAEAYEIEEEEVD